ncbi:hypothetical protein ACFV80_27530 [Streptomyces sp. NPDC059862]
MTARRRTDGRGPRASANRLVRGCYGSAMRQMRAQVEAYWRGSGPVV